MTQTSLVTKNASDLKVYTKSNLMGAAASVSTTDVQVPSLILMQSNSPQVEDLEHVKSGDFLHSITHEVWGGKGQTTELVFVDMFKTQIWKDVSGAKPKWMQTLPWKDEMETDEYETEIDGVLTRREKCFNYVVFRSLDVREMASPTGEKAYVASPIVVKFKGGSLKNGKRLNQIFQDYANFGAPSWATTFKLKANQEEKDGSKYWAYDFEKGEQTLEAQQLAAESLCKMFQKYKESNSINVVDLEEEKEVKEVKRTVKNHAPTKDELI